MPLNTVSLLHVYHSSLKNLAEKCPVLILRRQWLHMSAFSGLTDKFKLEEGTLLDLLFAQRGCPLYGMPTSERINCIPKGKQLKRFDEP